MAPNHVEYSIRFIVASDWIKVTLILAVFSVGSVHINLDATSSFILSFLSCSQNLILSHISEMQGVLDQRRESLMIFHLRKDMRKGG